MYILATKTYLAGLNAKYAKNGETILFLTKSSQTCQINITVR